MIAAFFHVLSPGFLWLQLVAMEVLDNTNVRVADRLAALDRDIRAWGRLTRNELKAQLMSMGLEARADSLVSSVNYHSRRKDGEIERVSIRFARHGIFLERGVGRGRPIGSEAAARNAKPWLRPLLPAAVESLADRIAEGYADIVAAEATIRIPGILDSKIRK